MITKSPDFHGDSGKAWRLDLPKILKEPEHEATLMTYIVQGNNYHPFWDHWLVSLATLAEIPGAQPAFKKYPEAMYEVMVVALDPKKPLPDLDHIYEKPADILTPPDVILQFHGVNVNKAKEIVTSFIKQIVAGELSPDQDYKQLWKMRLADQVDEGKKDQIMSVKRFLVTLIMACPFWIMPLALLIVIWVIFTILKDFGRESSKIFSDK